MAVRTVGPTASRPRSVLRLLASLALLVATGCLVAGLTRLAGTSWTAVAGSLRLVSPLDLTVLAVVWAAGLWCHSWVLTAAMPGLTRRRALLLNLSGSAIADVIPFGAAAGTGVHLAMLRSWDFSVTRFASFTAISNLWNVMAKLALPTVALSVVLAEGTIRSGGLLATAQVALGLTAGLAAVAVAAIADARIASGLGRAADRVTRVFWSSLGSDRTTSLASTLPEIRQETAAVIRRGWPQLSAGVVSYLLMQAVLWALCLHVVGGTWSFTAMLAGFAVERLLSMLPFTPGGAGLAEAGSIAILISLGGDPVTMTAGVLLYRGFAFLLEIPVGGAGLLTWLWLQRRLIRAGAVVAA